MLTENDHLLCLNETNFTENDCIILTNSGLGDIASIKSCDNITYKNGKPVEPSHKKGKKRTKCRKKSGFGSAMVSKISKGVEMSKNSGNHEIVHCVLDLHGVTGAVITAYRSPSMRTPEIENFYSALNETISDIKSKKPL